MRNLPTRLLLTCAAIGVAAGIVLLPVFGFFSAAAIAVMPLGYAALLGAWFFAGVLIQSLTHRAGTALVASLVAGLVAAPFTPYGFTTVASTATVGLMQELPFLATLYRRWPAWLFYTANTLIGVLYAFPAQRLLAVDAADWVRAAMYPVAGLSALAFTCVARVIARRLERTGVTQGLRPGGRPGAVRSVGD
ncbi:ECF transporter S component [Microbacterium marinilacus]|uniref:Energy-coupling factor transport system substrate-specific component n=1 Tax=Microbacterium marinilacus TaxID=415209 RepID=A0ABP7B3D0_9MICO|nr:ECF transporter S component [Microbacterium marinilacus]MBY0687893.1 ECF transporter S component [Microbacterium marinilacus]